MKFMKRRLFLSPLCGFSFLSTACFSDDGSWREKFGTPSLLLENAMDICNVYPYDDMQIQYRDEDCLIKNKLKEVEVFNEDFPNKKLGDVRYFTFEAEWVPATSGPNYEHLIVHEMDMYKSITKLH